jgi:cobalt-zinc-cadmium efflux system protein
MADNHTHDHPKDHDDHEGHDHDSEHGHDHGHGLFGHAGHAHGLAPDAIKKAIWITLAFMLIEAVGGYAANSLALISDAAHMLTDVGAMLLSLFAFWVARRPSNSKMTFGYHRAEILGALASGLAIWFIAALLIYESIVRLQAPPEVQGPIVAVVATIGLAANLLSMRMLSHAKHENMNVKAAYLHMLSDALGSVGAVVAGVVLSLTHWRPIDPIVTILFSILMLLSSWGLVKDAVGVLMECAPPGIDSTDVLKDLQTLAGVTEAHDLHIWTVSSGRLAMSAHLIVDQTLSKTDGHSKDVLIAAIEMLEQKYKILHTTIQIEEAQSFRSERCYDCQH